MASSIGSTWRLNETQFTVATSFQVRTAGSRCGPRRYARATAAFAYATLVLAVLWLMPLTAGCKEPDLPNYWMILAQTFLVTFACIIPMALSSAQVCAPGVRWRAMVLMVVMAAVLHCIAGVLADAYGMQSIVWSLEIIVPGFIVVGYIVAFLCTAQSRLIPSSSGLQQDTWCCKAAKEIIDAMDVAPSGSESEANSTEHTLTCGSAAQSEAALLRPVHKHALLTSFVGLSLGSLYWSLQILVIEIGDQKSEVSTLLHVLLFQALTFVYSTAQKSIGFMIDAGTQGTGASYYYVMDFATSLMSAFLYRELFESVPSWWSLCVIQTLHLLTEWIAYPLRSTRWYYARMRTMAWKLPAWARRPFLKATLTAQEGVTFEQWSRVVCLEFMVRLFVLSYSIVCYMLAVTLFRYGSYRHLIHGCLPCMNSREYQDYVLKFSFMFVTEAINAMVVSCWIKRNHAHYSLMARLEAVLQSNIFFATVATALPSYGNGIADAYVYSDRFCTLDW